MTATGTRTTTIRSLDRAGAQIRAVHIHEVRVSEPMQLIMRIIDGDPTGEETIAGLDHFSFGDHSELFQLPVGYPARLYEHSDLADDALSLLASWFLQLPSDSN